MSTFWRDDKALVAKMLRGDEDAFREFFDRSFPGLYRFALTRLDHDADAAEEVVQVTLAKAVTKLASYRGEAALFTWLCTFCRHELSAHYQREKRSPRAVSLGEDNAEVRAALESLALTEGTLEAERRLEVKRLVEVTLDHLPPRYGAALEWKYVEGLTVREIAERLGLGAKAAESLLTRARQAFRDGFAALTGTAAIG